MALSTSRSTIATACLIAVLCLSGRSDGIDLQVPTQYASIQAAVSASQNGDRILVSPGTYAEPIFVTGKALTIEGIVDASGQRPILDGGSQARIMRLADASCTIRSLHFRSGNASNEVPRDGGAIFATGTGSLQVQHCVFEGCIASTSSTLQGGGGAIHAAGPTATVSDCEFRGNRAFRGSSLYGVRQILRCQIEGTALDTGGQVFVTSGPPIVMRESYMSDAVTYVVNTNARVSDLWQCGFSFVYFEVSGQLIDEGGNVSVDDCDCDGDGISDARLLAVGGSDFDGNGVLDACECAADLYADGVVNGADLGVLLAYWGPATSSTASQRCDIVRDGFIDGVDLGLLLASWGTCPD